MLELSHSIVKLAERMTFSLGWANTTICQRVRLDKGQKVKLQLNSIRVLQAQLKGTPTTLGPNRRWSCSTVSSGLITVIIVRFRHTLNTQWIVELMHMF